MCIWIRWLFRASVALNSPPIFDGYCALDRAREEDEASGSSGGGNGLPIEASDELSMTLKGYAAANSVPAPDSEDGESLASSQDNRHFPVSRQLYALYMLRCPTCCCAPGGNPRLLNVSRRFRNVFPREPMAAAE